MRIIAHCQQCFEEGLRMDEGKTPPYFPSYHPSQYPQIELDHWPFYEYTCPNGHTHRITLNLELYELLFQQAVFCIEDGYYRESIGTFHAALERFMEFSTEILSLKADNNFDFETIWKIIGNQSERQLGAFYITYQHVLGRTPQKVDENKVRIRNNVVHKGELVSKATAMEYGQYVMDYIRNASNEIKEALGEEDYWHFRSFRLMRKSRPDLNRAFENPIQIETDEGMMYEGIGSLSCSCFIQEESLATIEDCINADPTFGLMK